MRSEFLPYSPPLVGQEEIDEVAAVLRSDWLTTGPKTREFEREFTAFVGADSGLALNSCTAGLHTALAVLGIRAGDEVITSTMTFAATANVVEHLGARPVLVDVEPDTLNLDPAQVAAAVSPRTRAIVPVHYGGHPADLAAMESIAQEHCLPIIEDAAHALPAAYGGALIGSRPHPTAFSFYATKNMTTGEGGMLTGPADLLEEARVLSLHGLSREAWRRYEKGGAWRYDVVAPGFKYNMTDIQAALGLCQLRKLPEFHRRRCELAALYEQHFAQCDAIETPVARPNVQHAWHLYPVRVRLESLAIDRDRFIDELAQRNIGASVHFIPLHLHSFYRDKYGYCPEDFPVAQAAFERLISLPLNPRMTDQDAADVVEAVVEIASKFRKRKAAA